MKICHSWHSDVVRLLSQRCGMVENEGCGDVSLRHCDNVAVQHCQDVDTMLLQRPHNIKHLVSRPFYHGQFWFLSCHRKVRELWKYWIQSLSSEMHPLCFCLLLVSEQDKVARSSAKVEMKGLGRGMKRLQHSIVDLFPDILAVPNRWSLHDEWKWNTHTHTQQY